MDQLPLRVFIGFDPRQPVAYSVLHTSIVTRSSKPVAIQPLLIDTLPIKRMGLTPFTYSRFLVPWLMGYEGWALFLDLDMLMLEDVAELFDLADDKYAAMVVQNERQFEWASAILFNCGRCRKLTPEWIDDAEQSPRPHMMEWADPLGALPAQWNHLVGYDTPRFDAKLVHFTQGIPWHKQVAGCEYYEEWHRELAVTTGSLPWKDLMGQSVHAAVANGEVVPKLMLGIK